MRSVDVEGCLQSVGYAKCFNDDAVGKQYQKACWKKWYTGAADGVDCDIEVIEEEPRLDMSQSLLEPQYQSVDADQDQFYEDVY